MLIGVSAILGTSSSDAAMNVGQNLDGITYYSSGSVFANAFKACGAWLTTPVAGGAWDTGFGDKGPSTDAAFVMRTDGYPTVVPFTAGGVSQYIHTLAPVYENGTHRLYFTGKGTVKYSGPGVSATTRVLTGGTVTFDVTATGTNDLAAYNATGPSLRKGPSSWYIDILVSNSTDPVRDIRIMRPGYNTSGRDTFDSDFKTKLGFYNTFRVMDWQRTNNSPYTKFANTNGKDGTGIGKDFYSQGTGRGVSVDHICDLANETAKNIWICVPHAFTNAGMNDMAASFASKIGVGRKVHVEYSNEVWNGMFQQATWVANNVSGVNTPQKYGTKAAEVFTAFKTKFDAAGKGSQLNRTLAGQAANSWILDNSLTTAGSLTDSIAIAPYFGKVFTSLPSPLPTLDQLATDTYTIMPSVRSWLDSHKTLAISKGKVLVCYEGGQHYVGTGGSENNEALTDLLVDFNRDWRMRNLYRYTYMGDVNSRGVQLFSAFTLSSQWGKWGSWGSMEWLQQSIGQNSYEAVKEWGIRDWKTNNP